MVKQQRHKYLTWAFLASVGVLVTIWYAVTPYYSDDLVYGGIFASGSTEEVLNRMGTCGSQPFDWDWWWWEGQEILRTTSPRILDLMVVPLLWLPKIVLDFISGLTFALTLWLLGKV
ncbi:MAG: hypothetical protein LIP02_08060 [Bacteroidales bacterium]|nr:hypothetical protein [Bacteroidales bacterium]